MIYKVYYQETKDRNPKREQSNKTPHITSSLFKNLMKNILRMQKRTLISN